MELSLELEQFTPVRSYLGLQRLDKSQTNVNGNLTGRASMFIQTTFPNDVFWGGVSGKL